MNFNASIEDHEGAHMAAAAVLGVRVDKVEFDPWGLERFHGRTHLNEEDLVRLGSFDGRKTMGVTHTCRGSFSSTSRWGVKDDALVLDLCPTDHDLRL